MMGFNFDEKIIRSGMNSIKHDFAAERGMPDGLISLWIADMDFKSPPCVTEALLKTVNFSIYGYTGIKHDYYEAIKKWFATRFEYEIKHDWLIETPGVVFTICTAIRAFTDVSDAVLIQPPVYHPFKRVIESNLRTMVTNPLIYENGCYSIDFVDFEQKIADNKVKLFILCNPHNPVGRVWTSAELEYMGDICMKYGVIVVSDEIHCDFVYAGHKHVVFNNVSKEFYKNSVICTAPSKTFNLAGLQVANTFIEDEGVRNKFKLELSKIGYDDPNMMGLAACQSAYERGGDWVDALIDYLYGNLNFIREFLKSELPAVKLVEPEGTYLIWLDFNGLGFSESELMDAMVNKARLWISNGTIFGVEGSGFVRMNIASPLSVIKEVMNRLRDAFS